MDELSAPHHFAGLCLHRHGGGGIRHLLQPVAAIIIRAGRGGRQEGEARLRIDRHRGPDIGRSGRVLHVRRNNVEGPLQRTGARVDAINGAGILGLVDPVIAGPAQDQRVLVDGRRLNQADLPLGVLGGPGIDVNDAILAKAGAALAGVGIHAMQFASHGADIDNLLAGLAALGHGGSPIGGATIFQALIFGRTIGAAGGISPLLLAGIRLHRNDAVPGCSDIDRVVDEQGRGAPGGGTRTTGNVAGVNAPDALKIFHVFRRDLGGGGIFLRLLVAAKGVPHLIIAGRHHHAVLGRRAEGRQIERSGSGGAQRHKGCSFHLSLHLRPHPSQRCGRRRCRSRSSASRSAPALPRP